MKRLRALIVDDEPLARKGLRIMLRAHPDVDVIGEYSSAPTALEGIRESEPDMVFLDIQMPAMNGFEMLAALSPEKRPLVVFVTAYDRYALAAFEANAIDYLLKPVSPESLARSVKKTRAMLGKGFPEAAAERLQSVLDDYAYLKNRYKESGGADALPSPSERLAIKRDGRIVFVPYKSISYFEAYGDYVRVFQQGRKYLIHDTLKSLESKLPGSCFRRVHRSYIVNTREVEEVRAAGNGAFAIRMKGCAESVRSSRRYREEVRGIT